VRREVTGLNHSGCTLLEIVKIKFRASGGWSFGLSATLFFFIFLRLLNDLKKIRKLFLRTVDFSQLTLKINFKDGCLKKTIPTNNLFL